MRERGYAAFFVLTQGDSVSGNMVDEEVLYRLRTIPLALQSEGLERIDIFERDVYDCG